MLKSNPPAPRAVILTAINVEFIAVRKHLSNIREETYRGTVYERGDFTTAYGTWDVGIGQIGTGNSASAAAVERAITHFDPEIILFVGVAGGVKDVKIGDVVAAERVYDYESGKVHDTAFLKRPKVGMSSYSLIERAKAEARNENWLRRIYCYGPTPVSLPRPHVLVGPIAAGEKVIASTRSELFDFLYKNYNDTLAVEMEGRGFLEAARANERVQALIIRGISDLIDNKTSFDARGSQERAASHAAAFAFEILAQTPVAQPQPSRPQQPVSATPFSPARSQAIRLLPLAALLLLLACFPFFITLHNNGLACSTCQTVPVVSNVPHSQHTAGPVKTALQIATAGNPTYQDALTNKHYSATMAARWDENRYCIFRADGYHVIETGSFLTGSPTILGCKEIAHTYQNMAISVNIRIVNGHSGGLFVRIHTGLAGDYRGYLFETDSTGEYKISLFPGYDQVDPLQDWTFSSALKQGNRAINTLQVIAQGSSLSFYANNVPLKQLTNSIFSTGLIGFLASAVIGSTTETVYSDLKVYTH